MKYNKLLIVVDMQNDFVTGTLANKAAVQIIPNLIKRLENKDYSYLIFTRDTHDKDYLNTQEGKKLPVKHCIKGTKGWEIIPELEKYTHGTNVSVLDKPSFGFKNWYEYLDDDEFDEIELVGTCTSICVASNATILKAIYPETKISVDSSCCADITEEAHNAALTVMRNQQIEVK